ncbi:MAG: ABC transporter substrate-binding protein [Brevinema sp.]
MKKLIIFTIIMFVFGACATQKKEINLTYVKSPLNAPAIVAYKKNIVEDAFKKEGFSVKWHEINSGAQQTEAIAAGSVDIATVLGDTSAVLAYANGVDLKIISMFGRAPKAYMLFSKNPNFTNIQNIKGKKIAGPKGTVLHQLLLAALKKVGLTINDIEFLSMGIPEGLTAMETGEVDGALLGGSATLLAEKAGATLVTDGEGLLQGSTVIAANGQFIKTYPHLIDLYLEAHQATLDYMNTNPEESLTIVAEEIGLSEEETQAMLPWYNFNPQVMQSDRNNMLDVQEFLIQENLLETPRDLAELFL